MRGDHRAVLQALLLGLGARPVETGDTRKESFAAISASWSCRRRGAAGWGGDTGCGLRGVGNSAPQGPESEGQDFFRKQTFLGRRHLFSSLGWARDTVGHR